MKPRKESQVQEMLAVANRHKINYRRASTLKAITSDPATGLQTHRTLEAAVYSSKRLMEAALPCLA